MTIRRIRHAVQSWTEVQHALQQIDLNFQDHRDSTANPHTVTATQVGKSTAQWNAEKLQGFDVDDSTPTLKSFLQYQTGTGWTQTMPKTALNMLNKGDLAVSDGNPSAWADFTLAVGSNGQLLIADSAETLGIKWGSISFSDLATTTHTHQDAAGGGTLDHGLALAGTLADDDHTQYALLAGRSGGQTLYGGTGSGDDLTIDSTSHATKGDIVLGSDMDLNGNSILFDGDTSMYPVATEEVYLNWVRSFSIRIDNSGAYGGDANIRLWHSGSGSKGGVMQLRSARGTLDSPTILVDGDKIGAFIGAGYGGSQWTFLGSCIFYAESPSDPDCPVGIAFETGTTQVGGRYERMRITSDGAIEIASGVTLEFGDPTEYIVNSSTSTLRYGASTYHEWMIGGNRALYLQAAGLEFGNSNKAAIKYGTSSLYLGTGTISSFTERYRCNVTGNSWNGNTPIAAPSFAVTNWNSSTSLDCDATGEAALRDVVGTIIYYLQQYGLWTGTCEAPP